MYRVWFCSFLLLCLIAAKGQYVLIPDSNFRKALLNQGYAPCFDNTRTMLDTTCSGVLDSTVLAVADSNISSIEGVQYFKHLAKLNCSNNNLSQLPNLPESLTQLICSLNSITILPDLPNSITYLDVSNNQIGALPDLPNSLITLFCYENPPLDSFPPFPLHLSQFICGFHPVRFFPRLPSSLRLFWCNNSSLDSLPILPDSLQYFVCFGNQLTSLLPLPPRLRQLNCNSNELSELPTLPSSVTWLDCSNNNLENLPDLPDSLTVFNCSDNLQLKCLPPLHRIVTFTFARTSISCLPDTGIITNSLPAITTLPICGPDGCTLSSINEPGIRNAILNIYPNPSTSKLRINCQLLKATLRISDMTGREWPVLLEGNEIDVSGLATGVYYLNVFTNGSNVVARFVKE